MNRTGNLTLTTPSDLEVELIRTFDAPRAMVYDAFTRPELVKRWMFGFDGWKLGVCELDVRPGGTLRYEWHGPDGERMGLSGEYREVSPPERTVHTEIFDEDWTGGETVVTTIFAEADGRTTVTMTVRYASKEARDGAMQTPMAEGMEMGYVRLDELLASLEG